MDNIIRDPEELLKIFEEYSKSEELWVIYITGSNDPETGKSWCPDCVTSKPFIQTGIDKFLGDKKLVVAEVERSEWIGNKEHPYRTHSALQLGGVPALLMMRKDAQILKIQ